MPERDVADGICGSATRGSRETSQLQEGSIERSRRGERDFSLVGSSGDGAVIGKRGRKGGVGGGSVRWEAVTNPSGQLRGLDRHLTDGPAKGWLDRGPEERKLGRGCFSLEGETRAAVAGPLLSRPGLSGAEDGSRPQDRWRVLAGWRRVVGWMIPAGSPSGWRRDRV